MWWLGSVLVRHSRQVVGKASGQPRNNDIALKAGVQSKLQHVCTMCFRDIYHARKLLQKERWIPMQGHPVGTISLCLCLCASLHLYIDIRRVVFKNSTRTHTQTRTLTVGAIWWSMKMPYSRNFSLPSWRTDARTAGSANQSRLSEILLDW